MSHESLISVAEAIAILDSVTVSPRVVRVDLRDALGMRLAEQITSDRDYPPFDKSVMDGYAVRSADVPAAGTSLRVVETIAAGVAGQRAIQEGEAAAIMTGAPLPGGADAVIPVEETKRHGDRVMLHRPPKHGEAIARRGSDIEAGRVVLPKGVKLVPAQIAVAASVGAAEVSVFARPRVKVFSTGNEIVAFDQMPGPSQIRDSNAIMLSSLLSRMGCDVVKVEHVRDDWHEIANVIGNNVDVDALFITGGMSMGEFDYVPRVLTELFGAKLRISKLRIKPGKPFIYTLLKSTQGDETQTCHVFGLPGNPVSAFVCTMRLANRVLARLSGGASDSGILEAKLVSPLPANGAREFYQPAMRMGGGVEPLEWKGSADIYTLAAANALIIRPESAPPAEAGDPVPVIDLSVL